MVVGAHVRVATLVGRTGSSQNDHTGRAPVDAEGATGADVVVDDEHDLVGRILARSGVPVLEFRASIVIGANSLSFEMIRSLVERLPIMITPKWVNVTAQLPWLRWVQIVPDVA